VFENGKRVLIVDDERLIADTAAMIFAVRGFESRAVYSAEQAIEIMSQWSPHLAIIDIRLPGMNGIDLAIWLKSELPSCKVNLISGFMDATEWLDEAEKAGHSFHVFAKPTPPTDLLRRGDDLLLQGEEAC